MTFCRTDRESREHEDTVTTEMTVDKPVMPKVPLYAKDPITSKKAQAMRKDKKRQQEKLRSMGHTDYAPLPIDKHEPEFVSMPLAVSGTTHTCETAFSPDHGYNWQLLHLNFTGSMQKKTGRDHSENEGHLSRHGSVLVPP